MIGSLTIGHRTHMTQILRVLSANSLREAPTVTEDNPARIAFECCN